jgi:ligand-binding SRPBCC domain-containing protein
MRHNFQSEQWLPYPVEQVFRFFADPNNLPKLMPAWQKTRIESAALVSPPSDNSPMAQAGSKLTLSFRPVPLSPIRISWDAEIDQFALNDHFCDSQLRGPFAFWHHCHRVTSETRGDAQGRFTHGTLLRDELEYELPFGFLGELAHSIAVRRQIQSIFRYRHRRTEELMRAAPTA